MSMPVSVRALLALSALVLIGGPATAKPTLREIAAIAAGPAQVLWLGSQALVAQKGGGEILIWDQQQLHSLARLEGCGPSRMVATRDQNFLLACSQSPRLLVMNNRGQVVETFPRPPEEAGLVGRGNESFAGVDLSGITAMVQDGRGGTYLAVAGSSRPDASARGNGRIYYLSASRSSLTQLVGKLDFPAGLALSADGKWLYLSEGGTRQVRRYEVQPGQLVNPQVIVRVADVYQASSTAAEDPWPGTLALNSQGHLYIALPGDGRILITSSEGKPLATLDFPVPYITGFSFSRTDRILYVTGTGSPEAGAAGYLYEMRL